MKQVIINLPDEVAHRLEIRAAIDELSLAGGIEQLLVYLYEQFSS